MISTSSTISLVLNVSIIIVRGRKVHLKTFFNVFILCMALLVEKPHNYNYILSFVNFTENVFLKNITYDDFYYIFKSFQVHVTLIWMTQIQ